MIKTDIDIFGHYWMLMEHKNMLVDTTELDYYHSDLVKNNPLALIIYKHL